MSDRRFRELAAELGIDEASAFSAPWEARAFAIALRLSAAGLFSWDEFRARLIAEVGASDRVRERDGTADQGEYYEHFVRALEAIVTEKGIASRLDLAAKLTEIQASAPHEDHDH